MIVESNDSFNKQVRMIHRFQDQVFQRMPPERKARKLAVMKALTKSVRCKNKENENPLNNNMELTYNFTHSTPMKGQQVTDLDDIESQTDLTETELSESELCGMEEEGGSEEGTCWEEAEEPKLVISKIYDLTDGRGCGEFRNSSHQQEDDSAEAGITMLSFRELNESDDKHWRSLEALHETAEYEFCRSLEESKLFVSTASLLEEIEADLPSPYSLAKPLNHTFHTITSYRAQTRLARMDTNLTCPEILAKRESLEYGLISKRIDDLEIEATVQKTLADQAEKAMMLSKANKLLGVEHVECEKALLLANLRRTAVMQEAKKLRMLGEVSEKENFGQITISEVCFEVEDSKDGYPVKYICTATEREHVHATAVVDEIVDGKIRFVEPLKFQNLSKDFVIYIDLFKLVIKEPKKALLSSALMKKFKKMTAANLNRRLTNAGCDRCGFVCVSQAELRLGNVNNRENGRCIIQSYFTGNLHHPEAGTKISLQVKTDVDLKLKKTGFLNAFQQTCWHRRWFTQSGLFLESWRYPEDQEADKPPVDSIYLPDCKSAGTVGLEKCVRPHSFAITLQNKNEEFLFSASSHKDMVTWVEHLNLALEQIRLWKPNV